MKLTPWTLATWIVAGAGSVLLSSSFYAQATPMGTRPGIMPPVQHVQSQPIAPPQADNASTPMGTRPGMMAHVQPGNVGQPTISTPPSSEEEMPMGTRPGMMPHG